MNSGDDSVSMDIMDLDSKSEASDDEMLLNNNEKIPKQDELGQPNSGGYNIKNEVCVWGADKISQVNVSPSS